jgi:hypothetical protein
MKEYAQEIVIRPSDDNSDWKKNFIMSKIRISNNMMLMGENVTKIKKYFVDNVNKSQYLEIPTNWNSFSLTSFIETQRMKIDDEKKFVNEEWKKYIETTLKENKLYKDQLILYFQSIYALMSSQLRELVLNSIKNYHDFIFNFKKDEYFDPKRVFDDQFNPKFPFQRSFLEVSLKSASDRLSFVFSDELSDIHNKLIGVIHDIIKCSQDVERPDNLFIKNLERKNTLWEVPVIDPKIAFMITSIDNIIKENLDYVSKVTEIYEPFVFVLNEQTCLEKFKLGNPKREDIKKKINYYEDKLKVLRENMPNSLYLNLIRIDCTDINLELRFSLYNFVIDLLKYVQNKNITQKSKDLNERIDTLKDNLERIPPDEETLYIYETNLESYKNDKVPAIYNEYNDFLEWVFFYFDYDRYPIFPDSSKGESMGGMDIVIRSCNNIIKFIPNSMETFEGNLKEKRNIFETQLNKTRSEFNEELKKITQEIQQNRTNANALLLDDNFIFTLTKIEKDIEKAYINLGALVKKEELLGAYPTDDEKLEQCKKDLMPLIYYVQFVNEQKEQMENESLEIKNIDFPKLLAFIERSNDVFEFHVSKV